MIYLVGIFSLVGMIFSWILTGHFYSVRSGNASFQSLCNLNSMMNCDAVAMSRYAELVFGFPLSSFAAGWFLALLVTVLIARNRFWNREALRFGLVLSFAGVVISAFYFYILSQILKTYCLYCLVVDGANVSSFLLLVYLNFKSGFSIHEVLDFKKIDFQKWKVFVSVLGVSVLVSVLGSKAFEPDSVERGLIEETAASVLNAPVVTLNLGAGPLESFGPTDAPITIVEYSDFQCPHCKHGAKILHALLNRYPGKIRVVLKNFPLDPTCNRSMQNPGHSTACEAAKVAYCALLQGVFAPVYEAFFEHQEELKPGMTFTLAKNAGADEQKLRQCYDSTEAMNAISRDVEDGIQLGIQATPTLFINGRKAEGPYPMPIWEKVIDQLLKTEK